VLDRFLFAVPDPWPPARWTPQTITPDRPLAWEAVLDDLRSLTPERKTQPRLTRLSAPARRRWTDFFDSLSQQANAPDSAALSFQAPLQSYGARLALILHLLWWAAENLPPDASENAEGLPGDPPDEIGAEAVERAARLVDYFLAHARKAGASMDARPKLLGARALLSWIERARLNHFSRRDAHAALRARFKTVDDLEPALNTLVHHGYLRPAPSGPRIGPGRPSGPLFEVNPLSNQ